MVAAAADTECSEDPFFRSFDAIARTDEFGLRGPTLADTGR